MFIALYLTSEKPGHHHHDIIPAVLPQGTRKPPRNARNASLKTPVIPLVISLVLLLIMLLIISMIMFLFIPMIILLIITMCFSVKIPMKMTRKSPGNSPESPYEPREAALL